MSVYDVTQDTATVHYRKTRHLKLLQCENDTKQNALCVHNADFFKKKLTAGRI